MSKHRLDPFIVLYHHRHGVDALVVLGESCVDAKEQAMAELGDVFEGDRTDEYLEATPVVLPPPYNAARELLKAGRKIANRRGNLHPKDMRQLQAAIAKAGKAKARP